MRNLSLIFFFILSFGVVHSQNIIEDIEWAESFIGGDLDNLLIETDDESSLIVGGKYSNCSACYINWKQDTIVNNGDGSDKIFLAKINEDGDILWHKVFGGEGFEFIESLKVDNNNDILLYFRSGESFVYDDWVIEAGYNLFKLDGSGNLMWNTLITGTRHCPWTNDFLSTDCNNDIVLLGWVSSSYNFDVIIDTIFDGSDTLFQYLYERDTLVIANSEYVVDSASVYVTKLHGDSGELEWIRLLEHNSYSMLSSVDASWNSEINILGNFRYDDWILGGDTLLIDSSQNSSYRNTFILKLNTDGETLWVKKYFDNANTLQIKSSQNGNIIATGFFWSSTIYEDELISSQGSADLLVFVVDSLGNYLWGEPAGNETTNGSAHIAVNEDGEVYISGSLSPFLGPVMNKYSNIGELIWELDFTQNLTTNNNGGDISLDSNGNLYQSGTFTRNLEVGNDTLGNDIYGHYNFIIKYSNQGDDLENTYCNNISTGILEHHLDIINLKLYPNPADRVLRLSTEKGISVDDASVSIYDVTGGVVFRSIWPTNDESLEIDVSLLHPGFYIINLFSNQGIMKSMPIVIQR